MKIRSALAPGSLAIGKRIGDISPDANKRLKWFDYYYSHGRNARLACRHFDISPQAFYRWLNLNKEEFRAEKVSLITILRIRSVKMG